METGHEFIGDAERVVMGSVSDSDSESGSGSKAGLGTAFFYALNASFFCILLKHATFFYVFFKFLATYVTQKNFTFFS